MSEQYRAPHRAEPPADVQPVPPEIALLQALEDAGAVFPDRAEALMVIQDGFDSNGFTAAGEAMAAILARLPGGRRGVELKLALLGATDTCIQTEADAVGASRQSLWRSAARLRKKLKIG